MTPAAAGATMVARRPNSGDQLRLIDRDHGEMEIGVVAIAIAARGVWLVVASRWRRCSDSVAVAGSPPLVVIGMTRPVAGPRTSSTTLLTENGSVPTPAT